jgi:glutathione S-transferase
MSIVVYGDSISGNCLKVRWVLDRLKLSYQWTELDVTSGRTRTADFLAINPAGQVPAVVLSDGRTLAQSGAILLYFAEGSDLIPADPYDRARMFEWMFWEQYSHEPYVAVRRFMLRYLGHRPEDTDPKLFERGSAALRRMEDALADSTWFAGPAISLADVALVAYTRMAGEGGFDLGLYPNIQTWIARTEAALGLEPFVGIEAGPAVA